MKPCDPPVGAGWHAQSLFAPRGYAVLELDMRKLTYISQPLHTSIHTLRIHNRAAPATIRKIQYAVQVEGERDAARGQLERAHAEIELRVGERHALVGMIETLCGTMDLFGIAPPFARIRDESIQ